MNEIKKEYFIKNLGKAADQKNIIIVLEPVDKQKTDLSNNIPFFIPDLLFDEKESKQMKNTFEKLKDNILSAQSLYQIEITSDQLKKLNKTINDKVTVTIQ